MNYYVEDLGRTAIRMPMENWGCDWMNKIPKGSGEHKMKGYASMR